jgi:hypothetical protein
MTPRNCHCTLSISGKFWNPGSLPLCIRKISVLRY